MQMGPAGMNAHLDLVAAAGVIANAPRRRHGDIALPVDKKPTMSIAAVKQILDTTVEHLAQRR